MSKKRLNLLQHQTKKSFLANDKKRGKKFGKLTFENFDMANINDLKNSTNNFSIFAFLLDLFFPKDYFDSYLQGFVPQTKIRKPDLENSFFDKILVSSSYSQIEKLLHRAKFWGELAICDDFAEIMTKNLEFQIKEKIVPEPDLLVFVPPDKMRFQSRGYHLPKIIADKISQKTGIPITNIFQKIKETQAQTKLGRQTRLVNLQNTFELTKEINSRIGVICLIDDISTTGTTLNECVKILKQNYPYLQVFALVLASN